MTRRAGLLAVAVAATLAGQAKKPAAPVSPYAAVTQNISADSLRGRVSFLASDALEGRKLGFRGLDVAAEYVASEFRAMGIEAGGTDGYFQPMKLLRRKSNVEELRFHGSGKEVIASGRGVAGSFPVAGETSGTIVKVDLIGEAIASLRPEMLKGRFVAVRSPQTPAELEAAASLERTLVEAKAVGLLVIGRLWRGPITEEDGASGVPMISVRHAESVSLLHELPAGESAVTAVLRARAPEQESISTRNVIGLLRGSDPVLGKTWIILSAHYDHIGTARSGADVIYNGANDNASGTAAVLEVAAALTRSKFKPRRGIAFVLFTGEEEGLLGSEYYARHPLLPLADTVANLNLEVLGRPPAAGTAKLTGFHFSDLSRMLVGAALKTGLTIEDDPQGDEFFLRSDNYPLAKAGVPAHTLGASFEYPEYHQPGDEWPKLDYVHMVRMTRAITAGVLAVASSPRAPAWNAQNTKVKQFAEAFQKLQKNR